MKTTLLTIASGLLVTSLANAQGRELKPSNESLKREVARAVERGAAFMKKQQDAGGHWGDTKTPALTGLAVQALLGNPSREGIDHGPEIQKGLKFIRSSVRLDGGIYGKGLGNYNTSICMMALLAAGDEKDLPIIVSAREFLVNQQSDYNKKGVVDNVFDGGVGYGSSYSHPDLSNTYHALEALHYTKDLLKESTEEMIELDWDAAIEFVSGCQHRKASNDAEWVNEGDPADRGGFIYFPGKSMNTEEDPDGEISLRAYGSMSYAGLLSFVYADMDKDDPRIVSVMEWLKKNFSLTENPGMGLEGLFYYYNTMSKALSVLEMDTFVTADGKKVNWKEDLTKRLFDLQKPDGSWANSSGRWWESDPVLATSYAMLVLERLYPQL